MTTTYSARWVVPVSDPPIEHGAVVVEGQRIAAVGTRAEIVERFPESKLESFGEAVILPGLINAHTHLELTALRGYLENEERDFFAWLRKLTIARLERLTPDDIRVSATWGACEAVRAGITCVDDASDSALMSMTALKDVGLRGVVYQESFGPDARLAVENFEKFKVKVQELRANETTLVRAGVSPHAPYTVCGPQLEMIAELALAESFPLMMHAAESEAEDLFMRDGRGVFAEGLARRSIEWKAPKLSTIQHLNAMASWPHVLCWPTAYVSTTTISRCYDSTRRVLLTVRSRTLSWATGVRRSRNLSRQESQLGWVVIQSRATTRATFSKRHASRRCSLVQVAMTSGRQEYLRLQREN